MCGWVAPPALAANLYVNNSGTPACSDATARASNSAASPWCTIHRAAKGATFGAADSAVEAAAAGDTVYITCGTYEANASDTVFYVALNPVNEGTSGSPIRFQSVENTRDCIRITRRSGTGPGGSVIGAVNRDYIEWSGFDVSEADWAWVATTGYQNGLALFQGDPNIVGGKIEHSRLTGTAAPDRSGDNYTGIRIHGATVTIRNNHVRTFGTAGHNNSCTTWYFGANMVVENNYFQACGAGVYMKNNSTLAAGQTQHVVRYNRFEPNSYGVYVLQNGNGTSVAPILVYQNTITGGETGVAMVGLGGVEDAMFVKLLNNTIYNVSSACFLIGDLRTGATHRVQNNICSATAIGAYGTSGAAADDLVTSKIQFEHQVWHTVTTLANWAGIGTITLATWNATYSQDATAPAAITSDPLFVNAASGDFHLQAGSPARTHGRAIHGVGGADGTTIPAGAYITGTETIGLMASTETSPNVYRFRIRAALVELFGAFAILGALIGPRWRTA